MKARTLYRRVVTEADLEDIEIQRAPYGLGQRRRDGAQGQASGALRQIDALRLAELVHRLAEDDERQNVALVERRITRQLDRRLARGAAQVDLGGHARNVPFG